MEFPDIKFKHVCFDKDGTLTDVHATWVPITLRRAQKISQYFELPKTFLDGLSKAMGVDPASRRILSGGPVGYKPRASIIISVVNWLSVQKIHANENQLAEIFREIDGEVQNSSDIKPQVLAGVVDGIRQLKNAGFKISIYTSDRHKNTEQVVDALGLSDEIDAIIGGDDVKSPKPDPEGFFKACTRVGVEVAQSVYVGDTVDDMRMAKQGGCAGRFGLTQGLSSREELIKESDLVFETFEQLVASFVKNNHGQKTASSI